jgi:hypothetical protein
MGINGDDRDLRLEALGFERRLRAALAEKLHDEVIQGVIAASLMVDVAERAGSDAEAARCLVRIEQILKGVQAAAGRPVFGMLAPFGDHLRRQLEWLAGPTGGHVVAPAQRYPDHVELLIYDAVQTVLLGEAGDGEPSIVVGERDGLLVGIVRCGELVDATGLEARLRLDFRLYGGDADVSRRDDGWRVGFWLPI